MKIVIILILALFVVFLAAGCLAHNGTTSTQSLKKSSAQCPVKCSKKKLLKMDEEDLRRFSKKELKKIVDFAGHKIDDAGDDVQEWRNLFDRASRALYHR